jgi:hypothetical protein
MPQLKAAFGLPRRRNVVLCVVALTAMYELRMLPFKSSFFDSGEKLLRRQISVASSLHYGDVIYTNKTNVPPTSNQKKDWFQHKAWVNNPFTEKCWHVEDICHSSHRLFYDHRSSSPEHQPPFSVEITLFGESWPGRPTKLIVDRPNPNMTIGGKPTAAFMDTCTYSNIPNHLVFQGYFNDMLGEFYSRTLPWLYLMQDAIAKSMKIVINDKTRGNDTSSYLNSSAHQDVDEQITKSFLEQTQMYLHVANFLQHGKMLDSHHLFTEAFRSNPLLSITSLLDNAGCRCMKRLILCGYEESIAVGKPIATRTLALNTNTSTALIGAGASGPTDVKSSPYFATAYRDLRRQMRRQVIENNPFILHDIETFRKNAILQVYPSLNGSQFDDSAFRIVGLTQRNKRRRWLNLNPLIQRCNTKWFNDTSNVICVEVNVEKEDVHPVRQAVMHAACDMLIGIHGAQLTEAIWMKDASTVVELLPWIPPKMFGSWTRVMNAPTPLGEIFHETELNHIGYPLGRNSVPYCQEKTDETEYRECMKQIRWDDRNYQVKPEVLRDMITNFLPHNSSVDFVATPLSCDEWQRRAGEKKYVLYNVRCIHDVNGTAQEASVHHYYWPKESDE